MEVRFKKLDERAVTPSYSLPGDAGLDLTAISEEKVFKHGYIEYDTGISMEIPKGYVGLLFPRSSISKTDLRLCNSVGVIDENFRGSIKLRFKFGAYKSNRMGNYKPGDRVGQLVIIERLYIELNEVDDLSVTDRGATGFGGSGQ